MKKNMKQYLVIIALTEDKPGLVGRLAAAITHYSCSIETSRITRMGSHAVMALFVSGPWDAIAKLESSTSSIEKKLNISLTVQRSALPQPSTDNLLPYLVELMTVDKTGVIDAISNFFAAQEINIGEVTSNSYTNQQGTQLSNLLIRIYIPADLQISELRERFMVICDELNVDAILEPERL